MKEGRIAIDNSKLSVSSDILRALAHPLRIKILEFIDANGTIVVNKIYHTLNLEQSITSQHLRILRKNGLVKTHREGKFVHYSLNYTKIHNVVKAVERFVLEDNQEKN